jgi:hypothetical protein
VRRTSGPTGILKMEMKWRGSKFASIRMAKRTSKFWANKIRAGDRINVVKPGSQDSEGSSSVQSSGILL